MNEETKDRILQAAFVGVVLSVGVVFTKGIVVGLGFAVAWGLGQYAYERLERK